jgi:hypothetical protein
MKITYIYLRYTVNLNLNLNTDILLESYDYKKWIYFRQTIQ